MKKPRFSLLFAALLMASSAGFCLELPNIFSDHMILQREQPVQVWGKGDPGETITVKFAGQTIDTVVDQTGAWHTTLSPLRASFEPRQLIVRTDDENQVFEDVLVGEVWLCSGQSNMDWSVSRVKDGDIEVMAANYPAMRLYRVTRTVAQEPRFSDTALWEVCSPETVGSFSAVGYYFGRDLRQTLEIPIGLIQVSWGGTPAIAWTRESVFHKHPLLKQKAEYWNEQIRLDPENPPGKPSHRPASLANGMLATVAPYSIAGAIWYQGEADTKWIPEQYDARLRVMIEDWRDWWDLPEMPFGIVQLAGFMRPDDSPADDPWPNLRESQRRLARDLDHTGLAVAIDIGEADDIHPRNKQEVGRRLARWALADVYEKLSLRGGPEVEEAVFSDNEVRLTFSRTGSGLKAIDDFTLKGFTLAGEDGVFRKAGARIEDSNTVIVSTGEVADPVHVRYAWNNHPVEANLGNKERLPASPFEVRKAYSSTEDSLDILENHVEAGNKDEDN